MIRQINLNTPVFTRIKESNKVSCVERHDCVLDVVDGSMVSSRRPGLTSFVQLATGKSVCGFYYWENKNVVLAVSGMSLYKIDETGTITTIGTVAGNRQATFAEFRTPTPKVLVACGGAIHVTDGSTVSAISDAEAPTNVSFVRPFGLYAVANELNTDRLHYSDALTFDPEDWDGELVSAEGQPDDIVAVQTANDEIALFGSRTVERWYNDGSTPFSRIGGATVEYGCAAPYSIQYIDNGYFFLNDERRVVKMAGSELQVLSTPVDTIVSGLTTVSDAIGMHVIHEGRGLYVLTFPTEDKTLVYDYINGGWVGEWNWWNEATASYERWRGNCCIFVSEWNKTLVGDHSNGKIYYLNSENYRDDGQEMRSSLVTGHIGGNNHDWIYSSELRILLKRGYSSDGQFRMRYRDNGSRTWSNAKEGSLGNTGDNVFEVTFRRLGRYKSRQYEIYCTDSAPFTILNAFEVANG